MQRRRLTISLEPADYSLLSELAQKEDRSLSWLIGRAVKNYLEKARAQLSLPLVETQGGNDFETDSS